VTNGVALRDWRRCWEDAVDIAAWLRELGLERYEQAFRENEVGVDVLPKLTAEDLKEIGIVPVGDRRRLLVAIAALSQPSDVAPVPAPGPGPGPTFRPGEAERRQLTLLFCDMVDSTGLSARLDPEDLREVIRQYQDVCTEVITRYGGCIAKYLGDGVHAYFGWPQAHEDDAERAVRAGLELAAVVNRLEVERTPLAARIGIATGPVVVGDVIGEGPSHEETVVGETPNLAARLQALAPPGGVVIAQGTRRLLGGIFELEELGPTEIRGFAQPVLVWRVTGAGAAQTRFEAATGPSLAPLVGRSQEVELLLERWRRAEAGEGQVVILTGEAGIGKSRILEALRERLASTPHRRLLYQCSSFRINSPLYPAIAQLRRAANIVPADPPNRALDKLIAVLELAPGEHDRLVPLLAGLASIPLDGRFRAVEMSAEERRRATIDALVQHLVALSRKAPVLFFLEDAHWIDPTTEELVEAIANRIENARVLLAMTCRPDWRLSWQVPNDVTWLTLNRLGRADCEDLVRQIAGGREIPREALRQIIARTDGVPLFVEELTKNVLESGLLLEDDDKALKLSGSLDPLAIPETLQDSLMERLDRLGLVKETAQIGACIGRQFGLRLLAAVARRPMREVEEALAQLIKAGLVLRIGGIAAVHYAFKHALVQDAAYQSLLRSRRRLLHAQILSALEELSPSTMETEPELLAYHATQSGQIEKAVHYWHLASRMAIEASANAETIAHLSKGLGLLRDLPDGPARRRLELQLRLTLGPALVATKGQTDVEVGDNYTQALELSETEGDGPDCFRALFGLWQFHLLRAELTRARALGERCMALARDRGEPELVMASCRALGATLHYLGEFVGARAILEECLELGQQYPLRSHPYAFLADPRVNSRSYLCRTLWLLGFPDQAARLGDEALALAEAASHPYTLANNLGLIAGLHVSLQDAPRAGVLAERLMVLSREQGFSYWQANGMLWRGWSRVRIGEVQSGFADLRESVAYFRASGDAITVSHSLLILAEACLQVGHAEEGLQAIAQLQSGEERRHAAEIARLEGELLRFLGRLEPAAECFERAIGIAREQAARSLEVRAAISYACLWRDRGDVRRGRGLLTPLLEWFTEGFGTVDLKKAAGLLSELN
jgi:class 3 adenylate cyclase/tetratricopeptide (TPR) repeat protein